MKKVGILCLIAAILVIIGGLNWGLVGIFNYNVIDAIFGVGSVLSRIVYILVGLSAIYMINDLVSHKGKR